LTVQDYATLDDHNSPFEASDFDESEDDDDWYVSLKQNTFHLPKTKSSMTQWPFCISPPIKIAWLFYKFENHVSLQTSQFWNNGG
jgi:hypothetical protein